MTLPAAANDTAVQAEINITPFTDVLLVLLIIFMILAALVIPPGFERQMPPCACGVPPAQTHAPEIDAVVTRTGAFLVNGTHVTVPGLYPLLAQIHARAPRAKMKLFADVKAPYGGIIRVLDAAKAAGIGDVSFVTE